MNIAELLRHAAERHPERTAIRFRGETIRYGQLEERAFRAASQLGELGVERGDRVALILPNHPKLLILYHAVLKLGAVAISVTPQSASPELEHQINTAQARLVVTTAALGRSLPESEALDAVEAVLLLDPDKALRDPFFAPEIAEPIEGCAQMAEDDPGAIFFTSGTLGNSRGAVLTHGNVIHNVEAARRCAGITASDRVLCCVPLHHSFGQNFVANAALAAGAELILVPRWDLEDVVEAIEHHQATMFYGVPTMYFRLLKAQVAPERLASLRYAFSAAATMPVETSRQWLARYGLPIHEGYGLTETSPCAAYNHVSAWKEGSVGSPIEGVEIRVAHPATGEPQPPGERGELLVRGPNVMKGYYDDPDATARVIRDGWLHTGDLGHYDDEGYLYLVGRLKEMINPGGISVSPLEIENALVGHAQISDAAVVGVADPDLGERIKAYVVSDGDLTEGQVIGFVRQRLAPYKVPREVAFVREIPRGATGRRLRRLLD